MLNEPRPPLREPDWETVRQWVVYCREKGDA